MPAYLRRFANVDVLKSIAPRHLKDLLLPHSDYFASRGLDLPPRSVPNGLDHERLVEVLMSPSQDTPDELLDALFLIDEMASDSGMDTLLQEAATRGIDFGGGPNASPADIAVRAYLSDRELVERKHAEHLLTNPRSFETYQALRGSHHATTPRLNRAKDRLEHYLDDWFEAKKRSRGSRVFEFPKPQEAWFLVRHGDTLKREGTLKDGKPSSVVYRPAHHDVIVYDREANELRLNACNRGERELYCREFGRHLFGDEGYFPGTAKYSLEPLRHDGEDSLVCADVDGMEWVRLKEIQFNWAGPHNHIEIRKATDLFGIYTAGRGMPHHARIGRASFLIKFSNARAARTVTIRPPNVAQYTRDSDSEIVEDWLTRRGFIPRAGRR